MKCEHCEFQSPFTTKHCGNCGKTYALLRRCNCGSLSDRVQLFRQPRVEQNLSAAPTSEDIRLKGFIDVGEIQAVLSVDGVVATVPAGQRHGNVQVLEISPPMVILQRGRLRWKQTLYGMGAE